MRESFSNRTAVSLFSGAGGMDVGFASAGFQSVVACEIDAIACETFNQNLHLVGHSGNGIEPTSIEKIDLSKVPEDLDLVYGGPPCQGFSVAGKMDPKDSRSELIHSFFDVVDTTKPRAFVCENVKALAISRRWQAVRQILFDRTQADYSVALVVLTATDFGVPQKRERMFLIGIRRDLYDSEPNNLFKDINDRLSFHKEAPETVADIVRDLGPAGTDRNPLTCSAKVVFAKVPILRRSPYAGMLFNGAGRPIPSDRFSSTLPASMGGNKTPIVDEWEILQGSPSLIEEYHLKLMSGGKAKLGAAHKRLRRLTIKECMRIQTFPDQYHFAGRKSTVYRQIGNAVPCKLAEAVARTVDGILNTANLIIDNKAVA